MAEIHQTFSETRNLSKTAKDKFEYKPKLADLTPNKLCLKKFITSQDDLGPLKLEQTTQRAPKKKDASNSTKTKPQN